MEHLEIHLFLNEELLGGLDESLTVPHLRWLAGGCCLASGSPSGARVLRYLEGGAVLALAAGGCARSTRPVELGFALDHLVVEQGAQVLLGLAVGVFVAGLGLGQAERVLPILALRSRLGLEELELLLLG